MTQLGSPVLAPQGAPVYNHIDMLARIVLSGADTGGAFSIVEERAALGAMTPRHVHGREAETFIVVDGALEAWSDEGLTLVEAGSMIHLPPLREHAFRIASASARFYTLITPSGFERFFAETGVLVSTPFDDVLPQPGPVPPEAIGQLQAALDALGCTITGPPPFDVAPALP